MNKRGFTMIELLAVIVVLGIICALAAGAYNNYLLSSKSKAFKMAEKTLVNDVQNAYADCLSNSTNQFCDNHQDFGYQNETIYLKELIANGYSEKIKDPYDTDAYCDEDASYVRVFADGIATINNVNVSYRVCLVCGSKKSTTCSK